MQVLLIFFMAMTTAICMFIFFCHDLHYGFADAQLTGGNQVPCNIEGEIVSDSSVLNLKCFNCTCKNGFVQCSRPKCAPIKGCQVFEVLQTDECCPKCKGCIKNGDYHESGTQWIDLHDPCKTLTCVAGIITETTARCQTPCLNPMPPAPGQCCPMCPGTDSYLNPTSGACLLNNNVYKSGSQFSLDDCTQCSCNNSMVYCKKKSCPILNCRRNKQIILAGKCCPECRAVNYTAAEIQPTVRPHKGEVNKKKELLNFLKKKHDLKKESCTHADKTYKNGEKWNTTTCKTCTCIQGRINCTKIMCQVKKCPANSVLKVSKDVCCPVCEEQLNQDRTGVCTVIGGSHFRTFDNRIYAFIGSCKYQLTGDCDNSSFNIRLKTTVLKNDVHIKRVTLTLGMTRVDLQLNRVTKVNDLIVDLPYRLENRLKIVENDEGVVVTSTMGIQVQWNYAIDFLEISLPEKYRKNVCGLCGNFNGLADDDFTTGAGIPVNEPEIFAQSWTLGAEECLDTRKYDIGKYNLGKDQRLCSYIKGSVFEKCLKKIYATSYYETCLRDMRHCPTDNQHCHCKSLASYVRDCRKLGIHIPNWRKSSAC